VVGLGYDVQGNLANKNGVLHSFDFGNRLRTVTDPVNSRVSTYAYDGQGRRVKDVVNGAAKHSQYVNNGQLVLTSDANTVDEYVYLQGSLLAIRSRDIATSAYTTKYQHTDALGTPIAVTSQSRALLETSEYEPFGQQVNAVGAAKNGPGYTGHVQDAATGLTYMQQRYYDPMCGCFLSVDPVAANLNTGASFNRYNYASNSPYKFADPDGRQALPLPLPPVLPPPPPVMPNEISGDSSQPVTLDTVIVRAMEKRQEQRTHVTYTLTKHGDFGPVIYAGRASGYGTPEQIMMRRFSRHLLKRLEGYGNPTLDKSANGESGRLAIRGREQQLIDDAGGVGTVRVGNAIRGVSTFNPFGPVYHESSNAAFGPLAPYTGNGAWWDEF